MNLSDIPTIELQNELTRRVKVSNTQYLKKKLPQKVIYKKKPVPFDTEVYLVMPECHGNGGWCGSKTLEKGTLENLLCSNPLVEHRIFGTGAIYGDDRMRICIDENPNHSIAIWDDEDGEWEFVET